MKIMAEPVVHESADKDLLAGRALQLLTVLHSVFAHVRDAQDRLLWRDKTCPVRLLLIMSWKALLLLVSERIAACQLWLSLCA